jgi:effector-binding domain-containing protein
MVTDPKIDTRKGQPYASIRTQVTMGELGSGIIPQLHGEVMGWLRQQGLSPSGAPFLKYNLINMMDKMDLEMGWPTEKLLKGNERITTGVLPAVDYAFVVYTGPYEGPGLMDANRVLIEWGRDNNVQWDGDSSDKGDTFAARYETYFTDPAVEHDSSKWETEVAIKVAP